jgi:hypothetical protein
MVYIILTDRIRAFCPKWSDLLILQTPFMPKSVCESLVREVYSGYDALPSYLKY